MNPRNIFRDPAGNRPDYPWQVNHSEEQDTGKERHIEEGANTANTGLIRQQSDSGGLVLRYSGTIFHRNQVVQMNEWYALCEGQTILFEDYAGEEFEVQITSFKPTRHRTLRNPRDPTNAPRHFWRYEIEMHVIRVISGVWESAVV